jgi:hypothetical protein
MITQDMTQQTTGHSLVQITVYLYITMLLNAIHDQVFHYFSSVSVLHYLQAELFIKI